MFTTAQRWKEPKCAWTEKQNVVPLADGILFSFKQKGHSDMYYSMCEP